MKKRKFTRISNNETLFIVYGDKFILEEKEVTCGLRVELFLLKGYQKVFIKNVGIILNNAWKKRLEDDSKSLSNTVSNDFLIRAEDTTLEECQNAVITYLDNLHINDVFED